MLAISASVPVVTIEPTAVPDEANNPTPESVQTQPTIQVVPANPPVIALPLPAGAVTIVALGDSLTEGAEDNAELGGYPGRLIGMVQAVRPDSTMANFGHSGWSSDALINGDQGLLSELDQAEQTIKAASRKVSQR